MRVITEICRKILTPVVGLFKVIGTDTDRLATYDFVLVMHSNHGPTSYIVSENNGDSE